MMRGARAGHSSELAQSANAPVSTVRLQDNACGAHTIASGM